VSAPAGKSVVLIGAGGIGAPAAVALAAGGVARLVVVDDDRVDLGNLHRQILFTDADIGRPKLAAFAAALRERSPGMKVIPSVGRALPDTAAALLAGAAVVIDATDNFASRFLLADAAGMAGVPVVHAAAIRWRATVIAVGPRGRPCYRCLFEDTPAEGAPDCATAGVVGPVCGVAGALAADRALRILAGDTSVYGSIATFDGLRDALRSVPVPARRSCALCGEAPTIRDLDARRYVTQSCEAL
jgi:molybdopterin/thiamine biosynthesis adenylyltransferase